MMKYFYYADKETAAFLSSSKERVYLYGSCMGTENFGDVIQLKNAIAYHRRTTKLEPVIIFLTYYLESDGHAKSFKNVYGCDNFIFISHKTVDASKSGLEPLADIARGGLLHVYGGGFLNKNWGDDHIAKISDLLDVFGVSDWFASGQQVDKECADKLKALFDRKKPLLFGCRDEETQRHLRTTDIRDCIRYSFDDVTEIFREWHALSKPSFKAKFLKRFRRKTILWHLNFSYYANDRTKTLDKIKQVKAHYPQHAAMVAQGWHDRRALRIMDSLQSLVSLKGAWPYYEYKMLDFAHMAKDIHPESGRYPSIANSLLPVDMVISSSYHIAMLGCYFGKPTHLMSVNEYYSQKQKGLGLEPNFNKFLDNPQETAGVLDDQITRRLEWLNELTPTIAEAQSRVSFAQKTLPVTTSDESAPELRYIKPTD